ATAGNSELPKDLGDKTLATAAQGIMKQTSLDKSSITLASNKVSEEKIVFHNGMSGSVEVSLLGVPDVPGLTARLDKAGVRANQAATLVVRYEPGEKPGVLAPVSIQLLVEPTEQLFPVSISFK